MRASRMKSSTTAGAGRSWLPLRRNAAALILKHLRILSGCLAYRREDYSYEERIAAFMKGIVRKITVAAVLLWILPGLSGCGDKDRVDEIKAQGSLVAAMPEEGERSAWDQAYARELEQQVLEEMASDIGVTLRIERVKEQDLVPAVKQGRAHVAVGVPVLPGRQDEGYSLAYGRRASYLAVADGTVLDSWGALADGIVGYSVNTGPAVLRQLNTLSGIELKEVETGDAVSGLAKGDITAYVCGETEAREFMAAEGIQIQELPGLWPETYTFYTGELQYRLLGLANQGITDKLTE